MAGVSFSCVLDVVWLRNKADAAGKSGSIPKSDDNGDCVMEIKRGRGLAKANTINRTYLKLRQSKPQ